MPRLRPRLWTVGALVVLLASSCTSWFPYPQADAPRRSDTAPSSSGPAGVPAPPEWRRIDHPSLDATQTNFFVHGLAPGDATHAWFASGFLVSPSGRRKPVIWTSSDGHAWEREPVQPVSAGDRLFGVARYGQTAVAIGLTEGKGASQASVVWKRDSTGMWRPMAGTEGQFGSFPDGGLEGVVSTPDGLLAFGAHPDGRGTADGVGVWHSKDGVDWKPELGLVEQHGHDEMARAWGAAVHGAVTVVVGESFYVAAGLNQMEPARLNADGAIWTETGGTWNPIDVEAAGLGGDGFQQVMDVAWYRGGFLAVGRRQAGQSAPSRPAAWTSPDGLTWRPIEVAAFDVPSVSGAALSTVEVVDDDILVAGEADLVPLLWRSEDGFSWRREPLPQELAFVNDVQLPIRLEASGNHLLMSVNGANQAHLWKQVGGRWMNVATHPAFPPPGVTLEVTAITHGDEGYVAVGNAKVNGRSVNGQVWGSPDGQVWTPIPEPFTAAHLATVAWSPRGYVAAGAVWDGSVVRAATWQSPDGRTWRQSFVTSTPQSGAAVGVVSKPAGSLLLMNADTELGTRVSAWFSQDDRHWSYLSQVGELGEFGVGLCASTAKAIAVGGRFGANLGDTLAWRLRKDSVWTETLQGVPGEPRACATSDRADVVLLNTNIAGAQLWYRKPGNDWRQATTYSSEQFRVLGLTAYRAGFLAVGSVTRAGNEDFQLWASVDGSSWIPVPDVAPSLSEPGLQRGMVIASGGEAAVAGGYFATGASLWVGPAP